VYTDWLITVLRFDVEMRAQFDTVRTALADIAASIRTNQDATDESILGDVEGLRPPIAPPWCFETCVEDLTRIAEAAQAAGHAKAAVEIARQAQAIAEKTHDGEIALWCATFLMRADLTAGRRIEAEIQIRNLLEVASAVEKLPDDFEKTLAKVREGFGEASGVALGIESFRAARAEDEGKDDEALARWTEAARRSIPLRLGFRAPHPPLDALEGVIYGPDPARRGALLAARLGRMEQAWSLASITCIPTFGNEPLDVAKSREQLAARRWDGMLVLVVDRKATLVGWLDAQALKFKVLPIGSRAVRELASQVWGSVLGEKAVEIPTTPFAPSAAREAFRVLLEPLGIPLRGRIWVLHTPELGYLPLGLLVHGEARDSTDPSRPGRPRFLIEDGTFLHCCTPGGIPHVDDATNAAVVARLRELGTTKGDEADAMHAVQLEMLEGRGPLGTGRTHPWYWAEFELQPPK
jgi:hypothetical protein